jgi:hypothetical protein
VLDDPPDLWEKAHIEHSIRFVEHEHLYRLERDRTSLD